MEGREVQDQGNYPGQGLRDPVAAQLHRLPRIERTITAHGKKVGLRSGSLLKTPQGPCGVFCVSFPG